MEDSALASDDDKGGSLDHVNLVKSYLSTITLLSHISAELSRKRKNNLMNTVHADFLALCGPKPVCDQSYNRASMQERLPFNSSSTQYHPGRKYNN